MGQAKLRKQRTVAASFGADFGDGGRERLEQLRVGAYRHASLSLERARNGEPAAQLRELTGIHAEAVRALDTATADFLQNSAPGPDVAARIACRQGCNFCCYTNVEVSIVEAIAVAATIGTNAELRSAVTAAAPVIGGLAPLARIQAKLACPLLKDGGCSIYADRPRTCRAFTSYDVRRCEDEFNGPEVERSPVPTFLWPRAIAQALTSGLQTACGELRLQSNTVELTSGVATVLADPQVVPRWLAGESVFPSSALAPYPSAPSVGNTSSK